MLLRIAEARDDRRLRNRTCAASFAFVPNRTGDGCSTLHPFSRTGGSVLVTQVLAFAAVTGWAVAPRTAIPLLRAALVLYAFGIMP
jgi:hypothetical protein